jgi:rhodanese-related sulfurtransferase
MATSHLEISPAEVAGKLDGYRVIDVREPEEFVGPLGHIAGAENVPLGTLEARAAELVGGGPLLLVCRSGNRSGKACERLVSLGAVAPTNLVGGMIAWNDLGLTVVGATREEATGS